MTTFGQIYLGSETGRVEGSQHLNGNTRDAVWIGKTINILKASSGKLFLQYLYENCIWSPNIKLNFRYRFSTFGLQKTRQLVEGSKVAV